MPKFRFRAEAAIELRRKRDEEAQRALGEARRGTALAAAELTRQEELLADTLARAAQEESGVTDLARSIWHRNWMRRQRNVIEGARSELAARRDTERTAAMQAMEARRKLRALERLRERARQAYLAAERRSEQKEFDVLAGLRYVARHGAREGA